MMPHPSDEQLIAFALDDLDGAARDEVARHRSTCVRCDGVLTLLARGLDAYRDAPLPAPPAEGLVRLLDAQARAARPAPRPLRRPAAWLAAAAVLVAVFVGGFWAGRHAPLAARPDEALARPLPPPPAVAFHAAVASH